MRVLRDFVSKSLLALFSLILSSQTLAVSLSCPLHPLKSLISWSTLDVLFLLSFSVTFSWRTWENGMTTFLCSFLHHLSFSGNKKFVAFLVLSLHPLHSLEESLTACFSSHLFSKEMPFPSSTFGITAPAKWVSNELKRQTENSCLQTDCRSGWHRRETNC